MSYYTKVLKQFLGQINLRQNREKYLHVDLVFKDTSKCLNFMFVLAFRISRHLLSSITARTWTCVYIGR